MVCIEILVVLRWQRSIFKLTLWVHVSKIGYKNDAYHKFSATMLSSAAPKWFCLRKDHVYFANFCQFYKQKQFKFFSYRLYIKMKWFLFLSIEKEMILAEFKLLKHGRMTPAIFMGSIQCLSVIVANVSSKLPKPLYF